jgi:hypothetical protein
VQITIAGVADSRIPIGSFLSFYLELFLWTESVLTRVVLDVTKGRGEIASGEVVSREEIREVFAKFIGGPGLGFLPSMEEAQVRMVPGAGSATTAAIGECECTHDYAVL